MKTLAITVASCLVVIAAVAFSTPAFAKKHHRTDEERFEAKVHHRQVKEEKWASQSDQKTADIEEKHNSHESKMEKEMDANNPQPGAAPE